MKTIAVIFLVGMLLMGFGCPAPEQEGPKDCGEDMDCFIEAAGSCTPATMTYSVTVDLFGMLSTTQTFMEINGTENGKCVWYQRSENAEVKFGEEMKANLLSSGKSEGEIAGMEQQATESAKKAVGTEVTCKMDSSRIVELLDKWKGGSFSSSDLGPEECKTEYPPGLAPMGTGGGGAGGEIPETQITNCEDGTFVGNCSATKPKICDILGNLIDDAETCGCPPKSIKAGRECIFTCSDWTLIEECSADKPYYCNENAKLESRASICGCPDGYDVYNENCRNTCNDSTIKLNCSARNKPLYCNEKYELVMNPPKCGCHDWEIFENGGCFNPSAQTYLEGETVRINENVSIMVDDFEEKNCGGNMYAKFVLTVTNNGESAYGMQNKTFRLKRGNSGTIMERPEGCSAGSTYRWGDVRPGETRYGNVWFLVYGGTGDFYIEYDVSYPTVVKTFKIDFRE